MHTRNFIWGFGLALGSLALTGCGSESANQPPPGPATVDEFAVIPAVPDGAVQYDFPEQIVQPGADVETCYFMEPVKEDMFAKSLESYQGKFGHHLILFRAEKPEPVGSVRDCTSVQDMINLLPAISSVNFGVSEFPAGMAIRIPAGTQLVLQQHTVNTSENAIRLREAVHIRFVPKSEVQVLAGFYGVTDLDFILKPHTAQTRTSDCVVPYDMNLLVATPHMHEWGTQFWTKMGPVDNLKTVIDIPKWRAEMRDFPPLTQFPLDAPMVLKQGDIVRTSCSWMNTTEEDIIFPHEMCATAGYYYPAAEGQEVWTCGGSQVF